MPLHQDRRPKSRRVNLQVESLETRSLLANSVLSTLYAVPADQIITLTSSSSGHGLTPAQVQHAYGFDKLSFNNGTIAADGSGQTIAIVVANNDPNIANDLHVFDQTFGLADPAFQKVNLGATTVDAGWSAETALDVEWAHAVAPQAKILLVEAASANLNDMVNAVDFARNQSGVSVVSMSWGGSEFAGETSLNQYFTTPAGHSNVAFVAASGDNGAWGGTIWPSVSTNVLAVGATQLSLNSQGNYQGETGWVGSGGGVSSYVNEPGYQYSVQSTGNRTTPDVAYNGDPLSGYAVFSSVTDSTGNSGWMTVGGTSAGTPQWAGILALADQGRTLAGKPAIDNAPAAIYGLSNSAFNDVTSGTNGYQAQKGYDLVTGRGTPNIVNTVSGLVGPTVAGQITSVSTLSNSKSAVRINAKVVAETTTAATDPGLATQLVKLNAPVTTSGTPGGFITTQLAANNADVTQIMLGTTSPQMFQRHSLSSATFDVLLTPSAETIESKSVMPPVNTQKKEIEVTQPDSKESTTSSEPKTPTPLIMPDVSAISGKQLAEESDTFFATVAEDNSVLDFTAKKASLIVAGLLASYFVTRLIVKERIKAMKKQDKLRIEQIV